MFAWRKGVNFSFRVLCGAGRMVMHKLSPPGIFAGVGQWANARLRTTRVKKSRIPRVSTYNQRLCRSCKM